MITDCSVECAFDASNREYSTAHILKTTNAAIGLVRRHNTTEFFAGGGKKAGFKHGGGAEPTP